MTIAVSSPTKPLSILFFPDTAFASCTMLRTLRAEGGGGRGEGEQGGWLRWRGEGVEGSGQDIGLRPLAPEETQTSVRETRRALGGHRGGG